MYVETWHFKGDVYSVMEVKFPVPQDETRSRKKEKERVKTFLRIERK